MCEECNEEQKRVHELLKEWMKQQHFEMNTFTEGEFETGFQRMPAGVMIVQKITDKKVISEDGISDVPDGPVSAVYVLENEVDGFINDLIYSMGPAYFFKMIAKTLKKLEED